MIFKCPKCQRHTFTKYKEIKFFLHVFVYHIYGRSCLLCDYKIEIFKVLK